MLTWETSETSVIDPKIEFRTSTIAPLYPENFLKGAWWTVVLELRDISIDDLLNRAKEEDLGLRIMETYDEVARRERRERQYVAAYAQQAFLSAANRRGNRLSVSRMSVGAVLPGGAPAGTAKPLAIIDVPEGTVVTAVIDSGMAFAHDLFRLSDRTKTRVHFAWLMDAKPDDPGIIGRRFTKSEIDAKLAEHSHSGLLDEDAFYRSTGLVDFRQPGFKPAALRRSHGTHVMGLAAGFPSDQDVRTRPIICIQLRTDLVGDVTGQHLETELGLALAFVMHAARRFRVEGRPGVRPPLVTNFSFGNFAGPHDGTGVIEQMLDQAFAPPANPENWPKRRLVLPAGNGNLSRSHAEVQFRDGLDEATLDWRVQPDDRSASYVELWMPWRPSGQDNDLVSITVTPPGGPESPPVGALFGQVHTIMDAAGSAVGTLSFVKRPGETDRGVVDICILPTASLDAVTLAPAGLWKVKVMRAGILESERVQVWIQRDETLPGFPPFGRQSYFDNACYRRFGADGFPLPVDPAGDPCVVRRAGTLSGFACGEQPSVVAGYVKRGGEMADYSAQGPITPIPGGTTATRCGPDAAGRSDDSRVMHGVLSAGSRSGTLVPMSGTSVAAPQVAFWIARDMEAGAPGDRGAVQAKASQDDPHPPPVECAGAGRLTLPDRIGSRRP